MRNTSPNKPISPQYRDGSKGLRIGTPRPLTSAAFRVTSTKPCTFAVAARSASTTGTERMAEIRPQLSATAASIPSMRGPNASTIACSHTSSARALSGSRARTASTPFLISPMVNVLRKMSRSSTLDHHAATAGWQRGPFRTSEMTFVSTSQVTAPRRAPCHADDQDRSHRAAPIQ